MSNHKTRDELFTEAVAEGAAAVGGGSGGGKGSSVAKRVRKQAGVVNSIESEIKAEGAALNSLLDGPKEPLGGGLPKPPASRGARGVPAPAAVDADKGKSVAVRDAIARYTKLVESNPDRYGDVKLPDSPKANATLGELKAVLAEVQMIMRRRAATNAFKGFFLGLPRRLEELSVSGAIPLNLIGLEEEILGDEPVLPPGDAQEELKALTEELAVEYDWMFAVSPLWRAVGLFASSVMQVHKRNEGLVANFGPKNPTDN